MSPEVSEYMNLAFRWLHVVSAIMWVGHLWFFNFVNAQAVKTYDDATKQKVIPELIPRALYWSRWGAAFTWISGFFLLGIVIYMGGVIADPERQSVGLASGVGFSALFVVWGIYEVLWSKLGKSESLATALSFALLVALSFGLNLVMSGRALFIHLGASSAPSWQSTPWMRIWPNQRRVLTAIKAGTAPPAAAAALAALRTKHNAYLSFPLVFFMLSNHFPTVYGSRLALGHCPGVRGARVGSRQSDVRRVASARNHRVLSCAKRRVGARWLGLSRRARRGPHPS